MKTLKESFGVKDSWHHHLSAVFQREQHRADTVPCKMMGCPSIDNRRRGLSAHCRRVKLGCLRIESVLRELKHPRSRANSSGGSARGPRRCCGGGGSTASVILGTVKVRWTLLPRRGGSWQFRSWTRVLLGAVVEARIGGPNMKRGNYSIERLKSLESLLRKGMLIVGPLREGLRAAIR